MDVQKADGVAAAVGRDAELKAIAAGGMRIAFAWAEAETRFDRMPHDSVASRTATGWRLDGSKAVVVAAPIAAGHACLTPEERELGVALVEIGADITNVAVFAGGMLLGLWLDGRIG